MTPLRLILKHPPSVAVDASALCPDRLAGMARDAIGRLRLPAGRQSICVGELFSITGDDPRDLVLCGDCRDLHCVGARMTGGRLQVLGDVGRGAGQAMQGGLLSIQGSAGDAAGQSMRGGRLSIAGDAGDCLAAPDAGERSGMSGGSIVIGGNVGAFAGHRMRRGMLLIAGTAGPYCAAGMVAGTIALGRSAGPGMAVGMRRGTLLLARAMPPPEATFTPFQPQELGFLNLLIPQVAADLPVFGTLATTGWQRSVGDRAVGGLGEILTPNPDHLPSPS